MCSNVSLRESVSWLDCVFFTGWFSLVFFAIFQWEYWKGSWIIVFCKCTFLGIKKCVRGKKGPEQGGISNQVAGMMHLIEGYKPDTLSCYKLIPCIKIPSLLLVFSISQVSFEVSGHWSYGSERVFQILCWNSEHFFPVFAFIICEKTYFLAVMAGNFCFVIHALWF